LLKKFDSILVLSIDRDNDFGKKASVQGPIIGRKDNLNAAAKLALADPNDSDANTVFAAVKKFDEVKGQFKNVQVATLTGAGKIGFESDRRINEQLDSVLENFPADAIVLVTDGAEDDQVMPILQSRAPVISKETVIIKQAKEVESAYYSIKEALGDPDIARIVFLIPGIVILLWGILIYLGQEKLFFMGMIGIIGLFFILKGTGLEAMIAKGVTSLTKSISLQRYSFSFYIGTIFVFLIGVFAAYVSFTAIENVSMTEKVSAAFEQFMNFTALSALAFVAGRSLDTLQLKRAYYLRKYFLSAVAIALFWFLIDSSRRVILGEPYASIEYFALNIFICFVIAVIAYKISNVLDIRRKITKLLVGLPVYDKYGKWVGKVSGIDKSKDSLVYTDLKGKSAVEITKNNFRLQEGKVMLAQ
jgi:putative membrane protein